jgi:hypothetical protein
MMLECMEEPRARPRSAGRRASHASGVPTLAARCRGVHADDVRDSRRGGSEVGGGDIEPGDGERADDGAVRGRVVRRVTKLAANPFAVAMRAPRRVANAREDASFASGGTAWARAAATERPPWDAIVHCGRAVAFRRDESRRENVAIAWKEATLARLEEACGHRETVPEKVGRASGPEAVAI